MQYIDGIPVWGEPLQEAVDQLKVVINDDRGKDFPKPSFSAIMANNHIGYFIAVGGVVAYERAICVNGVGFDIACGNKAVRLDCTADSVIANI